MVGRVVSAKLQKTATVLVERTTKHPLYKKTFIRSKRYLVDDRIGVKEGDIVEIVKTKPVSKNKHWVIVKLLGRSLAEIAEQELKEKAEEVIAEAVPAGPLRRARLAARLEASRQVMLEEKLEAPQVEQIPQVPQGKKTRGTRDTSKPRGTSKKKEAK